VLVLAVLLVDIGSLVELDAVAVLVMTVPPAVLESTFTTIVNTAVSPAATGLGECRKKMLPVPPTAGVFMPQPLPLVTIADTKVVLGGVGSLTIVPAAASLGPLFAKVIVYVMLLPATTGSGELVLVTAKSALAAPTSVIDVELLFARFGSLEVVVADAVLLMVVPPEIEESTFVVRVIVSVAPAGRFANVTVRLLPEPPHTPEPVELQLTNETSGGRLSVTTTLAASPNPLLATVMVYVN
jgi:hypothetical protein